MGTAPAKILVIDDERSVCVTCRRILAPAGYEVDTVQSGLDGVRRAESGDYEVVLLDLKMPDIAGMDVLERLGSARPDITVIVITGYATIQTSIEAIKKGAFNYVPKPFTPEELTDAVKKAFDDRQMRSENESLRQEASRLKGTARFLGRSKAMEEVRRQILKVAPSGLNVMIYGESGTGKELVAESIHANSGRSERAFVAVDISSLSPGLVESELFGHVKGAFTGATQNRPGYFAAADGGTLFLDEMANMSLEMQGKLLRVLESHKIRAVGSELEQVVDVRIVAATNRDLYQLVEQGTFREDLFYRLNVIPITVPPLRERDGDVPLLAMHFLNGMRERKKTRISGFTTAAMAKMLAFHWPGNVRQLRNIVERLAVTVEGELIDVQHLPDGIAGRGEAGLPEAGATPTTIDELKVTKRKLREMVYEKVERRFIDSALQQSAGNVSKAAQIVGMQRTNFHALMRKYGIKARRT